MLFVNDQKNEVAKNDLSKSVGRLEKNYGQKRCTVQKSTFWEIVCNKRWSFWGGENRFLSKTCSFQKWPLEVRRTSGKEVTAQNDILGRNQHFLEILCNKRVQKKEFSKMTFRSS